MNGACVPKQVDVASGCLGLGQSGRDEVSKPSPQGPVSGMQGRITSLDLCEQGLCLHLLASANARAGLGRQTLPFGTVARRRPVRKALWSYLLYIPAMCQQFCPCTQPPEKCSQVF